MIQIYRNPPVAVITVQGTPTLLDMQENIQALYDHPDHQGGMNELWDLREALLTAFKGKEAQALALFVSQNLDKAGHRTALVVNNDVNYGILRMWEVYAGNKAPQDRRIFRDFDEAFRWATS